MKSWSLSGLFTNLKYYVVTLMRNAFFHLQLRNYILSSQLKMLAKVIHMFASRLNYCKSPCLGLKAPSSFILLWVRPLRLLLEPHFGTASLFRKNTNSGFPEWRRKMGLCYIRDLLSIHNSLKQLHYSLGIMQSTAMEAKHKRTKEKGPGSMECGMA